MSRRDSSPLWRVTVHNPLASWPYGREHVEVRAMSEAAAVARVQAARPGYNVVEVERRPVA